MKYLEFYNNTKTYMYPNGELADPERVLMDYPAINIFKHVIETDKAGQVFFAIDNFSATRTRYDIDDNLSDEEALEKIIEIINQPASIPEPSSEEIVTDTARIANALEEMAEGTTSESTEIMNILLTGEEEGNTNV